MTKNKRASTIDRKLTTPDTPKRRPRSQDLPGLEERAIQPLEAIAAEYADIRDRRMDLTREETALRERTLALLHQLNRTEYRRDGIEIRIVPGEEKLAVKIHKADPDDEHAETSSEEGVERTGERDDDNSALP